MKLKFNIFFILLILFFFEKETDGALQCKNPSGAAVDWWSMLKIPVMTDAATGSSARLGTAYVYLDSTAPNVWAYTSGASINSTSNALYQTLHPLYLSSASSLGYIMYNDEDPSGTTHSSNGHSKGVWAFDSSTGYWLTHSVPRYPPTPYQYPEGETTYGQSFLCVSLSISTLNNAGENLLFNKPYIFKSNMPSTLSSLVPNIVSAIDGKWITGSPYSRTYTIKTLGGVSWETFAKNPAWDNELWADLVAPTLQNSLLVETWMNGDGGKINSTCDQTYKVLDVSEVSVSGFSWVNAKDHSKWGVSSSSSPSWGCIGDINRVSSQYNRGGGALCLNNGVWAKTLRSVVASDWPC